MPTRSFVLLVATIACVLGCELASPGDAAEAPAPALSPRPPGSDASPPYEESELVSSLADLGDEAVASGDLDTAESRYRRALSNDPQSRRARVGLVGVLIRTGREEEARGVLNSVLETASGEQLVDALILLGELESGLGHDGRALAALARAVELDDDRYDAHHQLAELTGSAPRGAARDDDEILRRASEHPYDPVALLAGARVKVARGDEADAVEWLENALWLADVDRDASRRAGRLLAQIDPNWRRRTIVHVHVYADESVRREAGWRVRMRLSWRSASISLDKLIRVAFVPLTIDRFQSSRSRSDLKSISEAFHDAVQFVPSHGLVAVLTDRAPPRRRGPQRLGTAEFLGRQLVVRLTPGEILSRTLIHELLHIYGGVHVSPEIESLMNPSGESYNLDVANQAIAWLLRSRRFGPGGVQANILPYVDVDGLITAYIETLRVNLGLRRRAVKEARSETSRYVAAELQRVAVEMDPHLGDVASITAFLMWQRGNERDASNLYGLASRLFGSRSQRGQEMRALAEALR